MSKDKTLSAAKSAWLERSENGEVTRFGERGFLYDAKSRLVCAGVWVFDEERYYAGDFTDYDELYSFEFVAPTATTTSTGVCRRSRPRRRTPIFTTAGCWSSIIDANE